MSAYSQPEFQRLVEHLKTKKNRNMHRRQKRTVSGVSEYWFTNILKFESESRVLGHAFGPSTDFEYVIDKTVTGATFKVLRNSGSRIETTQILEKEPARILSRIDSDTGDNTIANYSEGQYYVKRSPHKKESDALLEAVAAGVVPAAAKKNILNWNFTVIKGRKKRRQRE